jgi:hypothetical protein
MLSLAMQWIPVFFFEIPIVPTTRASATPPLTDPIVPQFLIDLGATNDVLSKSFSRANRLLDHATPTCRTVWGFDGSRSQAGFEISLRLDPAMPPFPFIITTLKDAYNSILGMPWIVKHCHLIYWKACQFLTNHPQIAATNAASSSLLNTPNGTWGKARMMDKGVCVSDTLAPPQCKNNFPLSPLYRELASQQDPPLQFEQT